MAAALAIGGPLIPRYRPSLAGRPRRPSGLSPLGHMYKAYLLYVPLCQSYIAQSWNLHSAAIDQANAPARRPGSRIWLADHTLSSLGFNFPVVEDFPECTGALALSGPDWVAGRLKTGLGDRPCPVSLAAALHFQRPHHKRLSTICSPLHDSPSNRHSHSVSASHMLLVGCPIRAG